MLKRTELCTSDGICFYQFAVHFLTIMVYHAASHCSCRVLQVSVETGEADIKIFEGEKVFPKVATERGKGI